jgi:hypothetical protein
MRRRPKRLPDKPTRARVQAYQLWSALAFHGEVPRPMDLRPLLRGRCIALTAAKKNPDGSLTLYIEKESPGAGKESNWLPAPDGLIYLVMRLYWPKETPPSILPPGEGTWKPPGVKRVE